MGTFGSDLVTGIQGSQQGQARATNRATLAAEQEAAKQADQQRALELAREQGVIEEGLIGARTRGEQEVARTRARQGADVTIPAQTAGTIAVEEAKAGLAEDAAESQFGRQVELLGLNKESQKELAEFNNVLQRRLNVQLNDAQMARLVKQGDIQKQIEFIQQVGRENLEKLQQENRIDQAAFNRGTQLLLQVGDQEFQKQLEDLRSKLRTEEGKAAFEQQKELQSLQQTFEGLQQAERIAFQERGLEQELNIHKDRMSQEANRLGLSEQELQFRINESKRNFELAQSQFGLSQEKLNFEQELALERLALDARQIAVQEGRFTLDKDLRERDAAFRDKELAIRTVQKYLSDSFSALSPADKQTARNQALRAMALHPEFFSVQPEKLDEQVKKNGFNSLDPVSQQSYVSARSKEWARSAILEEGPASVPSNVQVDPVAQASIERAIVDSPKFLDALAEYQIFTNNLNLNSIKARFPRLGDALVDSIAQKSTGSAGLGLLSTTLSPVQQRKGALRKLPALLSSDPAEQGRIRKRLEERMPKEEFMSYLLPGVGPVGGAITQGLTGEK